MTVAASLFSGSSGFGSRNRNWAAETKGGWGGGCQLDTRTKSAPRYFGNNKKSTGTQVQRQASQAFQSNLETVDDGVDVEDGHPILTENVEADVALQVDVGVVHLRGRTRERMIRRRRQGLKIQEGTPILEWGRGEKARREGKRYPPPRPTLRTLVSQWTLGTVCG